MCRGYAGWATAHFPFLVATQCVVLRQAGRKCAPRGTRLGTTWPGLRARASSNARDSPARAHDLIFLVPGRDNNLRSRHG